MNRFIRITGCLAISAAITAGFYLLDRQREGVHEAVAALRWARQVASQAEGMTLRARESGESDPIAFAVNYLSQGLEPRLIKLNKFQGEQADLQTPELFTLDREAGTFDYSKILNTEDLTGVRVQLNVGYTGFLGAKSRLANDLGAAALFALAFGLLYLATRVVWDRSGDPRLRKLLQGWSADSKGNLTQLGVHIREMVRHAQKLALASNRSQDTIRALRDRIHGQINCARQSRQLLKETQKSATQAESIALSAVIEANRLGAEGKRVAELAQNLHQMIHRLSELSQESAVSVQELERELEPWATDADVAFHAFDETARATTEMQAQIRKTTETVLGQAKLLQRLNLEVASPDARAERKERPAASPPPPPAAILGAAMPAPLPELPSSGAPKKRAPRKRSPKKVA